MRKINYTDAILALRPEAVFDIFGDDYSKLKWYDKVQTAPTEQEIIDKVAELQAIEDASAYKYKRMALYPTIGDQLDALFHAGVFPPEMAAKIQAVKDAFPKE